MHDVSLGVFGGGRGGFGIATRHRGFTGLPQLVLFVTKLFTMQQSPTSTSLSGALPPVSLSLPHNPERAGTAGCRRWVRQHYFIDTSHHAVMKYECCTSADSSHLNIPGTLQSTVPLLIFAQDHPTSELGSSHSVCERILQSRIVCVLTRL